jgi:prophage regulatory protein
MTEAIKKMLRLPAVLAARGCSKSKLYADIKAGVFPAPVKIGPRISAWPESDVEAEQRVRIAERDRRVGADQAA